MVGLKPMPTIKEQALLLGPRRSLVGVITEGDAAGGTDRPTVVILNSGIIHRVGANRMSVTLARALAASGHAVLRFDLSGVGDSEARPEGLPPVDGSLADIKEALDALEASRRTRRVILAGLCAGADLALLQARFDRRVVGAVLLDPSMPRTLRHRLYHYRGRLFRLESWLNVARGRNPVGRALRAQLARRDPSVARDPASARDPRERVLRDPEVRVYLERAYQAALGHGTQFMAVLSGERSYYREQLLDAFPKAPFGQQLRLEYFREADHMFSAQEDSARLVRTIVDWTTKTRFAGGDP
jgi:pimeloyl-ACP methyl ester carboxylesterase